jgi:SRSO17 transposase
VENIAEQVDGGIVRTLQKFIAQGGWEDRVVLAELRRDVMSCWADDDAVLNVDETGFPKKGTKSVGVKRQYAGILGRTDNCQVGVFVNYATPRGHVLIDRRLFLPQEWAADDARRRTAGVPENLVFRTKPELALEMVQEAITAGVRFRWVGGDALYGDSPKFVQGVRALGKWYVLDSSRDAHVWTNPPQLRRLGRSTTRGGRPRTRVAAKQKPQPVGEIISQLPRDGWKRLTVAEGSQGPRVYEYQELTVWFSEEGAPAESPERLLIRRSWGQEAEIKVQRSNAPSEIPLLKLAEVGGCRWTVEEDFQCGKGECGLDEYETRGWQGWHHHTALSMLALWFLARQKERLGEKRAANDRARSSHAAASPTRPAALERTRNPRLVRVAARA